MRKTGPGEQERGKQEEPLGKQSPPLWRPAFWPIQQQPLPSLPLCTQVICDNQRELWKAFQSIAHQVNEVFHNPEQVHRAWGHLGTERV